jgi:replicative DNA helicase
MLLRDGRQWRTEHWDRIGLNVWPTIDWPIYVDDLHGRTISDITASMRRMAKEHGVRAFIYDNLSETVLEANSRGDQRLDRELGMVARAYRDAAHALDAVPVLLVHLNREIEKRPDPTPRLADLKNSGDIEDASHLIAFLSRNDKESDRIRVDVAKHRNGATGHIFLQWTQQFMAVEDVR